MKTFTVEAERSGKWWVLQCREAPGAISQVRSLSEAHINKEAISWMTGVPENEIDIKIEIIAGDEIDHQLAEYEDLLATMKQLDDRKQVLQLELAQSLLSEKRLSYHDIGSLLHMSYQRIGQLVVSGKLKRPAKV